MCHGILFLGLGFLLTGTIYPNNSVITLNDIGNRFTDPARALFCFTPNTQCCSSNVSGEWYLPDGTTVSSFHTTPFSRSRVPSAVSLHRDHSFGSAMPPTGVFRCEIPDASGTSQNIYVGIYPRGLGKICMYSQLHAVKLALICFLVFGMLSLSGILTAIQCLRTKTTTKSMLRL